MRGSKTVLMLGSALLFGGAAAYLAVDWINSQVSHLVAGQSNVTLRKVAIAAADLRAGKELVTADPTIVQWPASTLPDGAVTDAAEFDALCRLNVHEMPPQKIKSLRENSHLSQAVFAAVLNTSVFTVREWEAGDKRPSGPLLKLLNLIERKGLETVL